MAEVLLAHHLAQHGIEARVHSAGTLGWGGPATANSVAVMAEHGLDLGHHQSRRLDTGLVVGADLVQSYGGRVVLAELAPGHSTTATIERLARG